MARYLRQSTAATIVLGPFVDDTDGKTAETALTIAASDVKLSKNGATFGNANAAAAHMANGLYSDVLSTGNTDTLGRLVVSVSVSGALPVRHDYMVLPANVYDSIVGGSDNLQVDVIQWEGADASDTSANWVAEAGPDEADIWSYANRTITGGTVTAVGTGAIDSTSFDADAIDANALAGDAVTEITTLLRKFMVNRVVVNADGTITLYDDDGTTALYTWTADDDGTTLDIAAGV